MSDPEKPMTDMVAIKLYFFEGVPAGKFAPEYKALTMDDKTQLGEGIRNGTLTY